jgi:ABC-type bacteriocin/lantibiotic exporter with double-glycine peptidase domain
MSKIAEESISNIRTVKAFANEDRENIRFNTANKSVMEKGLEFKNLTATLQFLNNVFQGAGTVAIVYYGYVLEANGEISIGALTTFLFYQSMLVW